MFPPSPNSYQEWLLQAPYTACNDTRLEALEQAACLKCISLRRRDACLKTTSDTFWGADKQSCTWCARRCKHVPAWAGRPLSRPFPSCARSLCARSG